MVRASQAGFRSDIEGMRGVAVLAVLLFHFRLLGVEGGFVGVDIFFVLSGYLMTHIVLSERFVWSPGGVFGFYRKRFWRIAPAYYVTLIVTMLTIFITGWTHGLPELFGNFVPASFFAYNITAPHGQGYFATTANFKPFLHTWSLGVEMQFYLIWPLICFGILKCSPKAHIPIFLVIIALSFIASVILAFNDPDVAYYSLPTRLWQFAFGGVIVCLREKPFDWLGARLVSLFQLAASAVIIFSIFTASGEAWPTFLALALTLSVSFLLFSGDSPGAIISSAMSCVPLRLLGRVSYSLYLVHWPVFVLSYSFLDGYLNSPTLRGLGLLISLALALVLYFGIERPMREVGRTPTRFREVSAPIAATGVLMIMAFVISNTDRMSWVFPQQNLTHVLVVNYRDTFQQHYCNTPGWDRNLCTLGDQQKQPVQSVIWGDSHAEHFAFGMNDVFLRGEKSLHLFQKQGCAPVKDRGSWSATKARTECNTHNARVLEYLKDELKPERIFMAGYWSANILTKVDGVRKEDPIKAEQFFSSLEDVIAQFDGTTTSITLVNQVPAINIRNHLRPCKYGRTDTKKCVLNLSEAEKQSAIAQSHLQNIAERYDNVDFIDPKAVFCRDGVCELIKEGRFLYRDYNHLNQFGSKIIAERLFK